MSFKMPLHAGYSHYNSSSLNAFIFSAVEEMERDAKIKTSKGLDLKGL